MIERVGILTDEVSANFDEALDWCRREGLRHVEVRVIDGTNTAELTDEQVADVKRRLAARGLVVSAVASPLYKCALDPSRPVMTGDRFGQAEESVEAHHKKLERVIAIAKALGAPRIRIFSFWREHEPAKYLADIVRELKRAAAVAERAGIQLLVENEPSCNGGFADEVGPIVRAINSPAVKALWDPGNEAYGGREAFPAGYGHLKDVLAHVHLKDAYMKPDGQARCVPLGSGSVAWVAHFKALKADGYDGLFTIETHFTPDGARKHVGSKMTLDAIRAMMQEV
ncbi:MAG: sugar phosphate isomerase/epimerase family protein [Phycisphaerae bacterium]|nr:sugar phosphate isomerase/epimerase family protein [Tepidisphaeraceae bacterium]